MPRGPWLVSLIKGHHDRASEAPHPYVAAGFPGLGKRRRLAIRIDRRGTAGDGAGEPIHGFLQNELGSLIRDHLRAQRSDCAVIANPGVVPPVLSDRNMRVPDLGVTCTPLRPGQPTLADPVLFVEILSPGNQAKTWSNVWAYTSIKSVQEILVLHSGRIAADILRRSPEGAWPERTDQITGGDLILTSIAFRTPLTELYARTGLSA